MKTLWAPWRMEYITNDVKDQGCIFCPDTKNHQSERGILFVGQRVLAMMNKYPYINGHLLVAP
ncbi:MAG TPA: HIT family hydrolase, partial [Thermodesulfobacteriota bacterium]|nr:HIT family hydrolase [Thermodesulfobacteriota bacterium]